MGYLHIDNLYKNQDILLFKECYALEKINGTSANIKFDGDKITFSSGGEKHEIFIKLFDERKLLEKLKELFNDKVTIFGEAYGGKCQGMKNTYGLELNFAAFDVKVGDCWLNVPNAENVINKLELDFVNYHKVLTDINSLDAERDLPSVQAVKNGCGNDKLREGIILRPLIEVTKNNGSRVISKYKRKEFMETATNREVSPESLKILKDAKAIANEWVTVMRLGHVLDKLNNPTEIQDIPQVIGAMIEDVYREGKDEFVKSKATKRAISKRAAVLYKNKIQQIRG